MSEDINYKSNPLHGLSLKNMLITLEEHYGFDILYAYLNLNCFNTNADIMSSVKFLKNTQWAREKVENFYLYQYKNLPRCSREDFELSPRDRVIPENHTPKAPKELSLEDAARLQEKRHQQRSEFKNRPDRPHRSSGFRRNDNDEGYRPVTKIEGNPWAKASKTSHE